MFARKWAPLVDAANGGSASEFPNTLDKAIAGIKDVDQLITGHATTPIGREGTFTSFSPISKWSDLQEYAAFTHVLVDAARAAKSAGKTIDQALAELRLPDRFRDYNMTNARADIQRVYEEVK